MILGCHDVNSTVMVQNLNFQLYTYCNQSSRIELDGSKRVNWGVAILNSGGGDGGVIRRDRDHDGKKFGK